MSIFLEQKTQKRGRWLSISTRTVFQILLHTLFTFEFLMHHSVATILFSLVCIAIIFILGVTVVVIITVTMFMNDERRNRMWLRFKNARNKNRDDVSKGRKTSQFSHTDTTDIDDDVKLLHSYFRKRRHVGRDQNCDSNSVNHQNQIDIVSQEVQEWKKIQRDVKMQLAVLNKAVQQLHHKNSQNKIPSLKKAED